MYIKTGKMKSVHLGGKALKHFIKMIVGTFCMAVATNTVFQPMGIVTGGFSGLGIILWKIWRIPLWVTNTMLNVPVFFAAYHCKTRKFFWNTLSGAVLLSLFLGILPRFTFFPKDFYVNLILGSILMGIGLGVILKNGESTGGTDLMASLLKNIFPQFSIAVLLGIIDGMIVFMGIFAFGVEKACYALLCIYGITKITDTVVEGPGTLKLIYIISEKENRIAEEILTRKRRGVTKVYVKGGYRGKEGFMLMCMVSKKEVSTMKDIVKKIDPEAFVIISDARETIGEGFVNFQQ